MAQSKLRIVGGCIFEGPESLPALKKAWEIRQTLGTPTLNAESDADLWTQYNHMMNALPATQAYLWKSVRLMNIHPGHVILDNGARTCPDLENLLCFSPKELVINEPKKDLLLGLTTNIDHSDREKISQSSFAPQTLDNIRHNFFDAARGMKLLQQHSPEVGQQIVTEMMRVTKPGGRIVFCDLDWKNITTTNDKINEYLQEIMFRDGNPVTNPLAAQQAANWLTDAGAEDVEVETVAIESGHFERFQLTTGWDRIINSSQRDDREALLVLAKKAFDPEKGPDEINIPVVFTIGYVPFPN